MKLNEMAGMVLISYHNVHYYVRLMERIREAIDQDRYASFEKEFLVKYGSELANA